MSSKDTTTTPDTDLSGVVAVAEKAPKSATQATFASLRSKPRRKLTFPVHTIDEDGQSVELQVTYQAISSTAYDKLLEAHPPKSSERAKGAVYDVDSFAPALISAVSLNPAMTPEQAGEIYNSDEWSGGEIANLFTNALRVCNTGLDVPFNVRD